MVYRGYILLVYICKYNEFEIKRNGIMYEI